MLPRLLRFFASLRLTVVCLAIAALLVFIGTLAQVQEGLYNAQNRYFRSLFIFWSPAGTGLRIPIFPGGYLVGGVLLLNLIAAQATRFRLGVDKIGIFTIHLGIILLLVGQLATDLFQRESHMRLTEGEGKNYSESSRETELAIIDTSGTEYDQVVAIPESLLAAGGTIRHPELPFTVGVRQYLPNSRLAQRPTGAGANAAPAPATQGLGQNLTVSPAPPAVKMDERNVPSAVVEILTPKGSLGTWLVSLFLDDPQTFSAEGKTYRLTLRPARHYRPFYLQLLKFTFDKYPGSEIPKNFSSRVRVLNPVTSDDRQVLIFMNNPLRYGGETFYQSGYDERDPRVTILQVVRNPGWLTPYLACLLVSVGLVVQFLSHLIGFTRERRPA